MENETKIVKKKFTKVGFPTRFTDSVTRQFEEKRREEKEDQMLIPKDFFEEHKKQLYLELPYCPKNEDISKVFLEKTHVVVKKHTFTKDKFHVVVKWKTKKVKQLFPGATFYNFKLKSPEPPSSL